MEDENKLGFLVMGIGIGLVAGLAAAFLLTPKTGKQSREIIVDKISDVGDRVKEVTADREKIYKETWEKPRSKPYTSEFKEDS
jgi:gas vesicle protein